MSYGDDNEREDMVYRTENTEHGPFCFGRRYLSLEVINDIELQNNRSCGTFAIMLFGG